MNLKKSIIIGRAIRDKSVGQVAESAGLSVRQLANITHRSRCHLLTLEKIAKALDYKVSEFIALGE